MVTMLNETEAVPGSQAIVQQRFNQAIELEKQLRSLIESKGPLGVNVRDLRCKIRDSYEAIILEDHDFAESHDVEQALWRLHYKQIEEFRTRIRKSMAATTATSSGTTIPMPGAKNITRSEPVQKVLASFKSFLSEAKGFYHELILKLRAKHGLPQDFFSTEEINCTNNQKSAADLKRCQLSCHRCLIYLGDLARYKELHGDADGQNHDWSVAANYYLKAVSFWPASGNPHNQLAVLATYVGDELLAVYRYFRSLAVEMPFLTARDNLILLFEKNRQHYFQLSASTNEVNSQASKFSESAKTKGEKTLPIGDGMKLALKDHKQQNPGSISEMRKSFRVRFVRLNGILFTKTSLETIPEVYAATICELEQLLALDDMCLEAGLGSEHRSGIGTGSSGAAGILQLVCILIFTVHNANGNNSSPQPTYAEVLQRSALLRNALTAAFELAGRLMRRCADSNDVSSSPFLPAMLVFTEWLASKPEVAVGSEVDEKQANARSFFWRQFVALVNTLYESKDLDTNTNSLGMPIEGGITLWEDYELEGFVPLIHAQSRLDYSISPLGTNLKERKELQVRVERLWAAGKAIGIAFDGTGDGIVYDEETQKFFIAGELKGRNKNEILSAAGKVVRHPQYNFGGLNDGSVAGFEENNVSVKDVCSKTANGDEDDEEYIVFKPVPKDIPAFHAPHILAGRECGEVSFNASNIALSDASYVSQGIRGIENLEISGITKQYPPVSLSHGQLMFPTCPFPDFIPKMGLQSDLIASDDAAPQSQVVTGFSSAAPNTLTSVVSMPVSLCAPGAGLASSVHQELQLNRQCSVGGQLSALPSPTLTSWGIQNSDMMFIGGSGKTNPPGVIGQQKQADASLSYWDTGVDVPSLARLSSVSISEPTSTQVAHDNLVMASDFMGLPSHGERVEHSGIPSSFLADYPFSALKPYPSAPLLPDDDNAYMSGDSISSNRYLNQTGIISTQVKDTNFIKPCIPSITLVKKENAGTSWMGPSAVGPPPGFGPPFKSGQSEEDAEGPLQVDDYAWLDGYTSSLPEINNQKYRDWGLPMYSSDNGIWSNPDKIAVASDTGFPFPGMGFSEYNRSDDQQLKQNLGSQLCEQLLQEHQTKWFDYDMELKPVQFGRLQSLYETQQQSQSQQQLLLLQQKQQEWYRQYHMGGPFAS